MSRFRLQAPLRAPAIAAALTAAGDVANATSGISTTFDSYYASNWRLSQSAASRTYSLPSKPAKSTGYSINILTSPQSAARFRRCTDIATEGVGGTRVRHEYSRRNPYNADSTYALMIASNGAWFVYNTETNAKVPEAGAFGDVATMGGDCEPCWHPTNPNKIRFTVNNGGMTWYEYDISTNATSTLFTLTGKLPAGFTGAARSWTKGEGRWSNDGRYIALMVETDTFVHLGVVCFDLQTDSVIGYYVSSTRPDHVSMAPLGGGWVAAYNAPLGTRYYPRNYTGDISGGTQVHSTGEHSDLCIGANGTTEYFVYVDYNTGWVRAKSLDGVESFDIQDVYPVPGESYALHISGLISQGRPGHFILSTYNSYADYGPTAPAPTARYDFETIMIIEIKDTSIRKCYVVGEHHSRRWGTDDGLTYFTEPQATSNKDGTRIRFASNWIGRSGTTAHVEPEDYEYTLASFAID